RAAEFVELVRLDRAAALDESNQDLAPALVRKPDHGYLQNGGMQRQAAFDLDRRDILPAADDHVVDATGDEEVAVAVAIPGVAAERPAVAQGFCVRLRPPPIAFERFIALQQRDDFAFLARHGE